MITIGDKIYAFDIERIMEFVNYADKNPSKETEIWDSYENGEAVNKTIRELTTPGNVQIDNINYDLVKLFIAQIITYDATSITDFDELPFGMKLAVNTMLQNNFLVELVNAE